MNLAGRIACVCVPVSAMLIAAGAAPPRAADPFEAGSTWVGSIEVRTQQSEPQPWALRIFTRDGENFTGEVVGKELEAVRVIGRATTGDRGPVRIRTEKKGFFQGELAGKLENGEVALTFRAIGRLGKPAAGVAYLKPKL